MWSFRTDCTKHVSTPKSVSLLNDEGLTVSFGGHFKRTQGISTGNMGFSPCHPS